MLEPNAFKSDKFNSLHNFFNVRTYTENNDSIIDELGSLLCDIDLNHNAAIYLLHKHFDLQGDEFLIRRFSGKEMFLSPENISHLNTVIPYAWRFIRHRDNFSLYPIEFIEKNKYSEKLEKDVASIYASSIKISSLGERIYKLNLIDIFGISLIPSKLFKLSGNQAILEEDTTEKRKLVVKLANKSNINTNITTQVLWEFQRTGLNTKCVCGSHCTHCGSHC